MWKQKIGIAVGPRSPMPAKEFVGMIKRIGFDAISPGWHPDSNLEEFVSIARDCGLYIESLHAPYDKAADMWCADKAVAEPALQELQAAVQACKDLDVPVLVVHAWIGFDYTFSADTLHFENYDVLVSTAQTCGVKIAFENTEGEEYLFALLDRYKDNDAVGFCWDSGHELCYNHSQDLLKKHGDQLIITHLNDNLGISRFDGKTFWTDDLHLLPYDGVADWDDTISRLRKAKYLDILNFELSKHSKPDRHENDVYAQMTPEQYFTEAYKRACKIAYGYSK